MPRYSLVDQPDTLIPELDGHGRLGVDTEFMREKTYFAQLCLVQLATADTIFCVDPLSADTMVDFWKTLFARLWIVHSARQDIEVVSQAAGAMPGAIFDTQIAAGLLGFPAQMGYADLVNKLFGVTMAKSHTRADWSRRPLREAFLEYAAEDVEHLLPAYDLLAERLEKAGRLQWAREDSERLLDPRLYDTGADQAITRLKGARNLRGRKRAAAARLAAWREEQAIRRNRPRQWILRDTTLLDIVHRLPASESQLEQIDGLPPKFLKREGRKLLQMIATSADDENDYRPPTPPDEQQKALLKTMQARVQQCAGDLGIAAEALASKRELASALISGTEDARVFSGWRRDIIGDDLLQLM